jgi:outer membrane lipoprotein-sorting protein
MHAMRRRPLLLLPLLPAAANAQRAPAPPAAPPPAMPSAEDIARVETYLNGIRTLRARFLQVDQRGRVAEGTLYLQRPGRMRFEYDPPSPILIVADGTTVTYQDRQLGQITSVFLGQTPLSIILAERVRLAGDVTVLRGEKFGAQSGGGRQEIWLTRTASPREGTLILSFATEPFALAQWRVIDAQAQEVRVTLSRIERDMPLEARLFRAPQAQPGQPGGGG